MQWTQVTTWENAIGYQEKLFLSQGQTILAQIVWRGCGVSILGDGSPTGNSPEQPALARHAQSRRKDWMPSGGPFQPTTFLDSLINISLIDIFPVLGVTAKYFYVLDLYFYKN